MWIYLINICCHYYFILNKNLVLAHDRKSWNWSCYNHLLFHTSWMSMWLPGYSNSKKMSVFSISLFVLNSSAMLLFASSALSAGTQVRPCMNPEPCARPAQLSSTRSSWAALSQSRELDYPLALKLHPLSFPLGRGWEAALGTNTQISHLLIKKDFSHILTGQMDNRFEKQWMKFRIFPQEKNKLLWNF